MAVKAKTQITVFDMTDAYSVILTSEAFTFAGNTSGAPAGLSCSTQAVAYCGGMQCKKVTIGTVSCPTGISAAITNNGTASPTITFKTTVTVTASCEATIPVTVDDVTINKKFSFSVAKTGATGAAGKGIKSTAITYQLSASSTTAPTGTWATSVPAADASKPYLWTKTVLTYTDGTTSTGYSVGSSIDGIEIGGRNLLINSDDLSQWDQSVGTAVPDSDGYFKVTYDGSSSWWGTRQKITLKVGQTYTLSGWCKGNASRLYAYADDTDQYHTEVNTTSTGKFLSVTFTPKQATSFYIVCYARKGITTYYKLPKLEIGNKATDWTPAPEDYTSDLNDKLTQFREETASSIDQTAEAIKSTVYDNVYLKGDVDKFISGVKTEVTQTKDSWQVTFDDFQKTLNSITDKTGAEFSEIKKYIRFEDGNILLGNSTSPLILKLKNDRIQFLQNGYEVAYISDQRMYNTVCEIIKQLKIADSVWTVETNAAGDTIVSLIGI
uniref:hypothetical protein n=1 Tax=Coprococcus catus TaxID=116085 RepID=UPI0022E519D5|nr:hypothetical protein [Coprococcus catus]